MTSLYDLFFSGSRPRKAKLLQIYQNREIFLERIIQAARSAFLERCLWLFDALVGEQACQIRTFMILDLDRSEVFRREVSLFNLPVVSDSFKFIVFCYLLTQAKTMINTKPTNYLVHISEDSLQQRIIMPNDHKLSKTQLKKLLVQAQQKVSLMSVAYIQQLCADISVRHYHLLSAVSCFQSMELLFRQMADNRQLILIDAYLFQQETGPICGRVRQVYQSGGNSFKKVEELESKKDQSVFVISGYSIDSSYKTGEISLFQEKFEQHQLLDLVLSNTAQHPQYPNAEYGEVDQLLSQKIRPYQIMAEESGCSRKNPSLFLIYHIYPSLISNVC